jgi:putative membrane protein
MKRSSLTIVAAAILAASTATAQTPGTSDTPAGIPTPKSSSPGPTDPSPQREADHNAANLNSGRTARVTNHDDKSFLKDFAQANAAEVDAGILAQRQTQNPDVKSFAKHMVEDHTETTKQVEAMATSLNVDVKAQPDLMHKAKAALLDGKSGADFDAAYMKAQISDHQKVVAMLQKEIREGQHPNVKQLASAALPHVQEHLEMAKQLQTKVVNNGNASLSSTRNTKSSPTAIK